MNDQKFSAGAIYATCGVRPMIDSGAVNPHELLRRHFSGDWGKVCDEDKAANDAAVTDGTRILSAYEVGDETVWIITEADRSATTILLPMEY